MTVRTYVCMYVYKYVYVTGFTKPSTFAQKLKSILLHRLKNSYTEELSMYSVSTVQCELVCCSEGHFADPMMSRLKEWCLQRAPIGWPYDLELLPLLARRLLDLVVW